MTDSAGVDGRLDVELVRSPTGRTRVARLLQRFPQRVTAPMYLDAQAPDTAFLCMQNPTGGVFPGDRLHTRIELGAGAGLQLTGQSATQVYAAHRAGHSAANHTVADHSAAEQRTELVLCDGATLEQPRQTTIPHRWAHYRESTQLVMHGDSVYLGWEAVAAGRIGHGERFEYGGYRAATTVTVDGTARAREVTVLRPDRDDPRRAGLLGGHDYLATFLAVAPARGTGNLADTLNAALLDTGAEGVLGAASPLPDGIGACARLLAHRAPALGTALRALWLAARADLLGRTRLPERVVP